MLLAVQLSGCRSEDWVPVAVPFRAGVGVLGAVEGFGGVLARPESNLTNRVSFGAATLLLTAADSELALIFVSSVAQLPERRTAIGGVRMALSEVRADGARVLIQVVAVGRGPGDSAEFEAIDYLNYGTA